jgi:hypothetical protein
VRILLTIAFACFLLGAAAHVLLLADRCGPALWWAGALLYLALLPVVGAGAYVKSVLMKGYQKQERTWRTPLRGCPGWMRAGCIVLGIYAVTGVVAWPVLYLAQWRNTEAGAVNMAVLTQALLPVYWYVGAVFFSAAVVRRPRS